MVEPGHTDPHTTALSGDRALEWKRRASAGQSGRDPFRSRIIWSVFRAQMFCGVFVISDL